MLSLRMLIESHWKLILHVNLFPCTGKVFKPPNSVPHLVQINIGVHPFFNQVN